jgi:hypothetical protein
MMRKHLFTLSLLSLILMAVMLFAVSCGDGDNNPDPLNVSGTWLIVSTASANMTAVLTHAGTGITGTVSDAANYSQTITGTSDMPASSTTGSRRVTLIVTYNDGMVATFTGTVNDTNTTINGTYVTSQSTTDPFTATLQ